MAVVICNETGLDLHLQILPENSDGLRVKAFLKKPAKRPRGASEQTLKKGENLTILDRPADTKVYHDLAAIGIKLWTTLHRGTATLKDGSAHEAVILTFELRN